MSTMFNFPKYEVAQTEVYMYKTLMPEWKQLEFKLLTEKLTNPKVVRNDEQIILQDAKHRVEFFTNSKSVWWTNIKWEDKETIPIKKVPNEDDIINAANQHLKILNIADGKPNIKSITYDEAFDYDVRSKKSTSYVSSINVNYDFTINNLPVFGSGAKIRVTLDENLEVVEWYRFWRDLKQEKKYKIIGIATAKKLIESSTTFSKLDKRKSEIVIKKIDLGYLALPPRETQAYLLPVFRFKGFTHTHKKRFNKFKKFIPAIKLTLDKIKDSGYIIGTEICKESMKYLEK